MVKSKKANTTDNFIDDSELTPPRKKQPFKKTQTIDVDGKRPRVASTKQSSLNEDAKAKQQAMLDKLKKENDKMKIKLAKANKANAKDEAYDDSESHEQGDVESEDEDLNPPSRFSSSIRSLGVVEGTPPTKLRAQPVGTKPAKRTPLTPLPGTDNSATILKVHDGNTDNDPPRGRKRERSPSATPSRGSRASSSLSLTHRDQKRMKVAPFRSGIEPSGKPKASDYDDDVKRRLLRGMFIYETMVFTEHAYPTQETQHDWAKASWEYASEDAQVKYALSHRMERATKGRGARARGFLRDVARPLIETMYGFSSNANKKSTQKNVERYLELMEDRAFHYKDPEAKTGFYENAIIRKIVRHGFFRDKHDRGIEHDKCFNPIPLATIAFVLTVIEQCITEWSTGKHVKARFDERTSAVIYESHLEGLTQWREQNPTVVDKILKTLFDRCRRSVGLSIDAPVSTMTDAMKDAVKKELENRTGETESESDGEM